MQKRRYPKHFVSKLTDADGENLETQTWLEFAKECQYIDKKIFSELLDESLQVGKSVFYMINNPGKFGSNNILLTTDH